MSAIIIFNERESLIDPTTRRLSSDEVGRVESSRPISRVPRFLFNEDNKGRGPIVINVGPRCDVV